MRDRKKKIIIIKEYETQSVTNDEHMKLRVYPESDPEYLTIMVCC